jgi:hypothetical protein
MSLALMRLMRHVCLGGRRKWPVKAKKLRKMRAFIVKCCGRQSCHYNLLKRKPTSSHKNETNSRKYAEFDPHPYYQQKSTLKIQNQIEKSSQPIESTSIHISGYLFLINIAFNSSADWAVKICAHNTYECSYDARWADEWQWYRGRKFNLHTFIWRFPHPAFMLLKKAEIYVLFMYELGFSASITETNTTKTSNTISVAESTAYSGINL